MRELLFVLLLGSIAGVAYAAIPAVGLVTSTGVDVAHVDGLFGETQSQWMLGLGLAGLAFAGRRRA